LQRFNEELRNKEFTYDHNGKIIVVQRNSNFKGRKTAIEIEYGIPLGMQTQPVSQRNLKQPEKRKKLPNKEA